MGESTRISWTDATWNPFIGCRKVSTGCAHCYAERLVQDRMGRNFRDVRRAAPATFYAPLKWGEPKKVFTCSISDFFIEEADAWRDEAWEVIRQCRRHTFQILTKRPERIAEHLPEICFDCGHGHGCGDEKCECGCAFNNRWPYPNVWLGTSVENQECAERRIPRLVDVPAKVHFLSCEPLLGEINLSTWSDLDGDGDPRSDTRLIDDIEWVIVGGESGPNFREMDLRWARSVRQQCADARVPFFFKQSSGPRSETNPVLDGIEWRGMPEVR